KSRNTAKSKNENTTSEDSTETITALKSQEIQEPVIDIEIPTDSSITRMEHTAYEDNQLENLVNNIKQMNENTVLQTSEEGLLNIKKQKQNFAFKNISEWLLAFKAYMDEVLIIYDNWEQELNSYKDHINELCIRYKFSAIMGYNEDCRVVLVMNQNTTLTDRDIEAEGKNLNTTAVKRIKEE
ncbi:17921_t:CDS:2, partial [Cetraspora pellucida]